MIAIQGYNIYLRFIEIILSYKKGQATISPTFELSVINSINNDLL